AWAATAEFLTLLPPDRRPPFWFCFGSVAALIASNWPAFLLNWLCRDPASPWHLPDWACPPPAIMDNNHPMHWLTGTFAAVVLSSFLAEMIAFRKPGGGSVTRIASSVLIATYLGVLPSFILQLRWPPIASMAYAKDYQGTLAVTLAVFVPKCCDVGAYLVGRVLGRHQMTPYLSPKKTWEGFAGGLATAVLVAIGLNRAGLRTGSDTRVFLGGDGVTDLIAVGFGITMGTAGVLGDLAESLLKREGGQKDASQSIPGFGGLMDVIDSVIFAAPV